MRTAREHPVRGALAAALAAAGWLAVHPVAAQQVTYGGSLTYSTGSYGIADRTHSFWLSNSATLTAGPVSFTASIPVILQNSGVVSFVAGQPIPTGGQRSSGGASGPTGSRGPGSGSPSRDSTAVFEAQYEVQIGDPLLWASLNLHSGLGRLRSVSIQASTKPPLRALDSGVGTGEWDFGGGASLLAGLGGTLVLLDAAYWSFGDLEEQELKESFLYSAGVSWSVLDARASILTSVFGATSIVDTMAPPLSAGASFLYSIAEGRSLSLTTAVGLSDASPDFSISLGCGVRLH